MNLLQEQWSLKNELILTREEQIKFNNLKESSFRHTSILDPALMDLTGMTKLVWEVFGECLKLGVEVLTKLFFMHTKIDS